MSELAKRIRSAEYTVELVPFEVFDAECLGTPGICWDFFYESQYSEVSEYDPVLFRIAMQQSMAGNHRCVILGRANGKVVGMILVDFARHFTKAPLAHLFVIYVKPEWRASPLGRMLTMAALGLARARKVTAFYAGITSGISSENTHRLGNMFRRLGFTDVGLSLKKLVEA